MLCSLQLDPIERVQVYMALAQTINTLFGLYLKVSGVAPVDHGTAKERVSVAMELLRSTALREHPC